MIQLLVFEETDIKIYWCVKGDIGQREAEANITFHTPISLDIGLFQTLMSVLLLFCEIKKVGLISLKQQKNNVEIFKALQFKTPK